jgi:DNA-binding CsgD family transcriptional regulator
MTIHPSLERISDLIGMIYDCVLDPGNWEPTLACINRELAFANSALGVVPLHAGAQVVNVAVGFDQEWLDTIGSHTYKAESVALWGGAQRLQQFPLDEPIVGSQTAGYPTRHTNRYFREILEPRGIHDAAMVTIARDQALLGYVAFNRHVSEGAIGESEIGGLRLLGPHFRRAVTISNLFDLKAIEASTFASTLDVLAFGVVLVDGHLTIVHGNAAAERMLSQRDPIRTESGSLTLPGLEAQAALERTVRLAATDETSLGPRGIGIPVRRIAGEPCVIHVLPLRRSEIRRGLFASAAAALFVAPAAAPPRMPADALALLYDLTPAETRVFEMLSAGMTQAMIAEALGIAASTVKTHVLHLFEKTGCQRQADLLKLATTLSSPV